MTQLNFDFELPEKEDNLTRFKRIIACLEKFRVDIEKALWYGGDTHDFDYVCARVLSGSLDLYELPNSAIMCETFESPKNRIYHGFIAVGDLQEIMDFDEQFLHEAAIRNCTKVTLSGRLGWPRVLKKLGYEPIRVTLTKDVPQWAKQAYKKPPQA